MEKKVKEEIAKALFDEKIENLIKVANEATFLYPGQIFFLQKLLKKKSDVIAKNLKLDKNEVENEIYELFKARISKKEPFLKDLKNIIQYKFTDFAN